MGRKFLTSHLLRFKSSKGFTLIELVIVIGILAILAVFVLAVVNPIEQFQKARDAQRKSDLGQIQKALEQYYQDNGKYPASNASYQITDINGIAVPWGGASGWSPYMNLVPSDPLNAHSYVYYAANNNQTYYLYASLERGPSDAQACKATDTNCIKNPTSVQYCTCSNVPANVTCGTNQPCNYGISSPNTTP